MSVYCVVCLFLVLCIYFFLALCLILCYIYFFLALCVYVFLVLCIYFFLVCLILCYIYFFLPLHVSFLPLCVFCLQCVLPIPVFLLHVLSCRALSFVSLSLVPVWSALSLVAIFLSSSFTPAFHDSPLGHMLHASLSFSCAHRTCSLFEFSLSVHFSFLSAASILVYISFLPFLGHFLCFLLYLCLFAVGGFLISALFCCFVFACVSIFYFPPFCSL